MRIIVRLLILAAISWLAYVVFRELQGIWSIDSDDPAYDPTKIVVYFLIIVALGIAVGLLVAMTVIPALGDHIGGLFFNPNEQIEKDPHAEAVALVNQGEYEEAVSAYKRIVRHNPSDLHAISEVIHLQCDKLQDYDSASEYLESFLQEERPADETAFLAERLVDVYWKYQNAAEPSIVILKQIRERLPDTSHSANAFHRLREIESASGMALTERPSGDFNSALDQEDAADSNSDVADDSEVDSTGDKTEDAESVDSPNEGDDPEKV